jgi:protein SMG6
VHLLEHHTVEDPEGREWAMIAVVNIGALLECGRPQGFLQRSGALGQDHPHVFSSNNPSA